MNDEQAAKATHTPGPYRTVRHNDDVYHGDNVYIEDSKHVWLAKVYADGEGESPSPDEGEANASLFTASPDLLDACEAGIEGPGIGFSFPAELEQLAHSLSRGLPLDNAGEAQCLREHARRMRAAIAKAKEETP